MKAYSYVRFSSARQQRGMSHDRQLDSATRYAHRNRLVLDTSSYKDLGVSAFKSKNVEGALGAFIEAVESKVVAKGSYLLIENLDRLSRDTVDVAMELFLSITRRGIVIVTLMDEEVYSSATIKENWTKLIVAMAVMARANEESATKSKRSLAAKAKRHAKGDYSAVHPPFWLEHNPDRTEWKLRPKPSAVVKRIFKLALGGEGARAIARRLNAESVPIFTKSKEWTQIQVSRILAMPAVMGAARLNTKTGTPTVKEGVYPAVVTKQDWERVRGLVLDRHTVRGSTVSRPDNVFGGLAFCGHCGERMRFHARTDNDRWYMKCTKHSEGVGKPCFQKMFQYIGCERALISHLLVDVQSGIQRTIFHEKHKEREALADELKVLKDKQRKLVRLAVGAGDIEVIADEMRALQEQVTSVERKLAGWVGGAAADNEDSLYLYLAYQGWTEGKEYVSKKVQNEIGASNLTELRAKLKASIIRVVKRVDFVDTGTANWRPKLVVHYINDTKSTIWSQPERRSDSPRKVQQGDRAGREAKQAIAVTQGSHPNLDGSSKKADPEWPSPLVDFHRTSTITTLSRGPVV
jgi:DNA invertase Pin-like site-specific DNA recombinase